jgi:hypothetical protein
MKFRTAEEMSNERMPRAVDATVMILNDLDKSIHASYGLGFPFQGDFFDPADNLEKKKLDAEKTPYRRPEGLTKNSRASR